MTRDRSDRCGDRHGDLHGQGTPVDRGAREGSERYFSEKIHESGRPPQPVEDQGLPPPQDMGEDG